MQYYNKDTGGSITFNRDFEDLTFDATMIATLSNLEVANQISLDTLWDMLEAGEILPATFDRDIERVRLLSKMMDQQRQAESLMGGSQTATDGTGTGSQPA
jgi:hypothetical protein